MGFRSFKGQNLLRSKDPAPLYEAANAYGFDFRDIEANSDITKNENAYASLAGVQSALQTGLEFEQITKDLQPFLDGSGIDFRENGVRELRLVNPQIANNKSVIYVAANIRPDTNNFSILNIARNASTTNSRLDFYVPSNRQVGFKAANNDGGAPNWISRGPAITLGQWITVEMKWDIANDTVEFWYDGVLQTNAVSTVAVAMTAYPATNPSQVKIGSSPAGGADGYIQKLIINDGDITDAERLSISTHMTGIRP